MKKPSFAVAWAAAQRIYSSANPSKKMALIVGGHVAMNIKSPDPGLRWENTCAVRMSYILNHAGTPIPYIPEKTASGADKRWYFYRVSDLVRFLEQCWGKPEVVVHPPSASLAGKQGVILFEVSGWGDSVGHTTLFNGSICYDHCYFNEPDVDYRTNRAIFWSLP